MQGLSPDTTRSYAYTLMAFFKWLGEDWGAFESLSQKSLQDWLVELKSLGLKPRSINQMLVCTRGFYRFCFGGSAPHSAGVLYPRGTTKAQDEINWANLIEVSISVTISITVLFCSPINNRKMKQFDQSIVNRMTEKGNGAF